MEQSFVSLLKKVDKIDLSAGRYMRTKARKLSSFEEARELSQCFVFKYSPQGHDYWIDICSKLGEY